MKYCLKNANKKSLTGCIGDRLKRLGLRASRLFTANPQVESLRRHDIKYKRSIPNKSRNLTAATSIAVSVAESIASACRVEFRSFVGSADALRKEVLTSFPGNWLGLRNLLMTCWSHGVPVVYLAELGKGVAFVMPKCRVTGLSGSLR